MLYNIMISLFQICGILLCLAFILAFIKGIVILKYEWKKEIEEIKNETRTTKD